MRKNVYKGKFIVFEGLDGSGQSTQARLLKEYLEAQGRSVLLTKEPTQIIHGQFYSSVAQQIRDVLDKKVQLDPKKLQELFAQDRREHFQKEIEPALQNGQDVICDRYFFSSFAFGSAYGNDLDFLIGLNQEFLLPDYSFLLKVSPKTCMQRVVKRNEGIKLFEVEEKLTKVWVQYEKILEHFPEIFLIDGERSIEEVQAEVLTKFNQKL